MSQSKLHKLKEEALKMVPPTVFFFVALHIVSLVRALMTQGVGLPASSTGQILVSSLILGKAVLLADMMPAINRFPTRALAYNITWKTVIYYVLASVIHYAERLYDATKTAGSMAAGNAQLLDKVVWPHIWGIQIVILVMVLNYVTLRELARVLGEEHLFRLFFSRKFAASRQLH